MISGLLNPDFWTPDSWTSILTPGLLTPGLLNSVEGVIECWVVRAQVLEGVVQGAGDGAGWTVYSITIMLGQDPCR